MEGAEEAAEGPGGADGAEPGAAGERGADEGRQVGQPEEDLRQEVVGDVRQMQRDFLVAGRRGLGVGRVAGLSAGDGATASRRETLDEMGMGRRRRLCALVE